MTAKKAKTETAEAPVEVWAAPGAVALPEVDDRVREQIWRLVGRKPLRVIAEELSLKPEEVLAVKREMLDSVDVLTIDQQRQQLMIEMRMVAQDSRRAAELTIDEYKAGLYNSAIAADKELLKQLAAMERKDSSAVEKLNEMRVRELLRLMDQVVRLGVVEIATKHGLDEHKILEVFQNRLVDAARELDAA